MQVKRLVLFSLVLVLFLSEALLVSGLIQASAQPVQASDLVGRWRVKFDLSGVGERHLVFDSRAKGSGSFSLLDAAADDKSVPTEQPAVWSVTTNDRVSFSGDLELQLGACCREMGTLIFKGKFDSNNSLSGRAIFVGSTIDEENFNGYRSTVGTFTATRLPN